MLLIQDTRLQSALLDDKAGNFCQALCLGSHTKSGEDHAAKAQIGQSKLLATSYDAIEINTRGSQARVHDVASDVCQALGVTGAREVAFGRRRGVRDGGGGSREGGEGGEGGVGGGGG
jgi:hypothetical protein